VIHPGVYTENPTITSLATQLITYDATGASTLVYGTVTIANTTGRIAGLKMTNLAITGNAQAYINSSTVDEQFTKSSSGYVEVDDCELQATGNVLISGSGITTIIGNKIANLVVNNAGASVLIKGANDCVMPQITAGSLNIVDSTIRASSNTANAVTASAGTVVTLMNNQIVTPASDSVARVSIAGFHSIISVIYDKANSTLSNSLNSVAYFQTANVDSLVSSGNVTGGNLLTAGLISATGNVSANYFIGNGSQLTGLSTSSISNGTSNVAIPTANGNVSITANAASTWTFDTDSTLTLPAGSSRITSYGQITIETDNNASGMYLNADSVNLLYANTNVTLRANSIGTNKDWNFGNTGSLTFPIGISIDNSVDPLYPKIIADSNLLFSVQGQGANGSAALAWSLNPNTDTQYAAVGVNKGGGDNLAKVVLTAGNTTPELKVWKFDETGNLTLPRGGIVYETSIPGGVLSGNTIALKPQGGIDADQQLLIYPTVIPGTDDNHLHLTTGNLYNTELFLGNDNLYVKLANTGNVVVNTNDNAGNSAQWTFGNTGTTQFPGSKILAPVSESITMQSDQYSQLMWENANLTVAPNMAINSNFYVSQNNATLDIAKRDGSGTQVTKSWYWNADGTLTLPTAGRINFDYLSISSDANVSAFYAPDGNVQLAAGIGDAQIVANSLNDSKTWTFGNTGNLAYPDGTISTGGAVYAAANASVQLISNNENTQVRVDNSNVEIYTSPNGITQYQWTFGNTGNLTAPGNVSAVGNVTAGNLIATGNIVLTGSLVGSGASPAPSLSGFSTISTTGATGNITASGNVNGSGATFSGNVTAQNFTGNINITGNVQGTSSNVTLVAGAYSTVFDNTGNLTLPGNTFAVNYANNTPVDVVTRFESSWTVPTGNSTQSFTVTGNNSYQMWVEGNIPNGIIVWNATVTITNTNVPAIGQQFAWNYEGGGNILMLTSIPAQIIGTAGAISNAQPAVANTNVFSFGINNTSGGNVTVRYGWIQIS
jgi:hypothetical protein